MKQYEIKSISINDTVVEQYCINLKDCECCICIDLFDTGISFDFICPNRTIQTLIGISSYKVFEDMKELLEFSKKLLTYNSYLELKQIMFMVI